jgi:hypothetical protein
LEERGVGSKLLRTWFVFLLSYQDAGVIDLIHSFWSRINKMVTGERELKIHRSAKPIIGAGKE